MTRDKAQEVLRTGSLDWNEIMKALSIAVKPQSVGEIVDGVKDDMCDGYCKYPDQIHDIDRLLDTVCSNCPLNRL